MPDEQRRLPLPMGLAGWGLNPVRRFLDAETRANLDMAADLLVIG